MNQVPTIKMSTIKGHKVKIKDHISNNYKTIRVIKVQMKKKMLNLEIIKMIKKLNKVIKI